MDIYIDFENYTAEDVVYKRTAARAIISRGDKFLMITSRFGDAKFPGGGKEDYEEDRAKSGRDEFIEKHW